MKLRAVTDFTLINGFQTPDTSVHTASARQPDVELRRKLENEAASLQLHGGTEERHEKPTDFAGKGKDIPATGP
jgi:hypothetical protein